jgi:acetyltransferase
MPIINKQKGLLGLMESLELVSSFGINIPRGGLVTSIDEAVNLADRIAYPVVMKVDSPELPHKTELGLVRTGLYSKAEIKKAFRRLQTIISELKEPVSINGILLQEMVTEGTELIIGIKRDATSGPLLVFGIGGVFTEILKDFSVRVCPINEFDAQEMIHELKGFKILEGFRGKAALDIRSLEKALLNLSHLAMATKKRITELDINPLIVLPQGKGVMAVDTLVVIDGD